MTNQNNSDYIFKAYLVNTQAYDAGEGDAGAWLYFPATEKEIQTLFENIGLPSSATPAMYFIAEYACSIEGLDTLLPMYGDINELSDLAQGLYALSPAEREKLDAVQSSPLRLTSLEQFREYPWNEDYFCLDAFIQDDATLGWNWLHQQGLTDIPESCRNAIQPESFGRYIREKEQGFFTEKGYITYSGDE